MAAQTEIVSQVRHEGSHNALGLRYLWDWFGKTEIVSQVRHEGSHNALGLRYLWD
jgi:hypothetical protein